MTKMLIAKIENADGSVSTVKTYANSSLPVRLALKDIVPFGAKIISHEWVDTLTENRVKWNEENPNSPISLDL